MTLSNTKIRLIQKSLDYAPLAYGEMAGQPSVQLKLSSSETNAMEVSSVDGLMERYGWRKKVRSGFARLRFFGSEPLSDVHLESLEAFDSIVDPRFIDMEVSATDVSQVPSRTVQNAVDSFSLFVPKDRSYDEDAFEFFADRSSSFGDVEFIFKVESSSDEDVIRDISREYKIYDSDIWLYPKGRKPKTVADRYNICEKIAKRNTWNVSPRLDIFSSYEPDADDE